MISDHISAATRRINRWSALLCAAGFVTTIVLAILNNELAPLGLLAGLVGALVLALWPLGFAVSAGLRDPGIMPDTLRASALLPGLGAVVIGVQAFRGGDTVPHGLTLAIGLVLIGAVGIACPFRRPAPARRRPSVAVIAGMLLTMIFARLPRMFEGTKEHAYYLAMRSHAQDILTWEDAVFADSNHYTATPDTMLQPRAWNVNTRLERTADGYRAWTTSNLLTPEYVCAVYAGTTRAEPAVQPGRVTCTPYPDRDLVSLATLALGGIVFTGLAGLAVRQRALRRAAAEPASVPSPTSENAWTS